MTTVLELIAALQQLPQHAIVLMHGAESGTSKTVLGVGSAGGRVYISETLWVRPSSVLNEHRDLIVATLARFGLTDPRVFGSVLHGTDTELSDLDLLVDPTSGTTLLDISGAMIAMNEALGIVVDLRIPGALPVKFRAAVQSEATPL